MSRIKIGDSVNWSGAWGTQPIKQVKIRGIIRCEYPGCKFGAEITQTNWSRIKNSNRNYIFDLDNGHWCWDFQISPLNS